MATVFHQKRLWMLFLPVVAQLILTSILSAAATTRIMPLGDSITRGYWGSVHRWGYRKPLYDNLTNGGYSFDFVGSATDGSFQDPNHEGHDGWRADQILTYIGGWLVAYQPDIVLLHIGTNDITGGNQDANEVNDILDVIDDYEADSGNSVTVILALIINRWPYSSVTTAFNSDVNFMAVNRIANGDDIIIVNMESALSYPADLADELHPNDSGYSKMANVWYNALVDYFNRYDFVISGRVVELDGHTPLAGVLIQADNNDINDVTDANGFYELFVDSNWSGTVTPHKVSYTFEPNSYTCTDVNQDYNDINYIATLMTFKISGFAVEQDNITPISDVNVTAQNSGGPWTSRYGGGSWLTDSNGYYEVWVDSNWSGKVTPQKDAYLFEPNSRNYQDVNQDYAVDQNYTGDELGYKISGFFRNECDAPIEGVEVDANNGGSEDTTDSAGYYEIWVYSGWSGTVTPARQHYTFDPNFRSYIDVMADQPDQNFIAYNIYDLDCDGLIGFGDFDIIANNWLLAGPQGDFIVDGVVDFADFAEFGLVWGD
jgi:lysophospholipase L1-like esterase